jgi:hypothetical protein
MIKPKVIAYSAVDCAFLNLTNILLTPSMSALFLKRYYASKIIARIDPGECSKIIEENF